MPSLPSAVWCRRPSGRPEGPFGDHYGYYSLRHDYPVFRVEHLAHRRDAIYPATVVGKPRQEDFFIGDLLQELLSPLFPLVMPAVESLWSYGETGYHSLAAAVVRQRYRREAMASAFRILGEGQLSLTKFLLVTDRSVDLRDFPRTLEHVLERTRSETDLYVFSNVSMDTLDYTGPEVNLGSKGVLLGLGEPVRKLPREFSASELPAGVGEVRPFCGGCLVVGGPSFSDEPEAPSRLAAHPAFAEWPLVVLTDEPAACRREPDQLPLDHLYPLRTGRGHPRGPDRGQTSPSVLHAADRHRCEDETALPGRALLRSRDRRARDPSLVGVLSRRRRRNGRLRPRPSRLAARVRVRSNIGIFFPNIEKIR